MATTTYVEIASRLYLRGVAYSLIYLLLMAGLSGHAKASDATPFVRLAKPPSSWHPIAADLPHKPFKTSRICLR